MQSAMGKILVFPSILSADFANFEAGLKIAKEAGADGVQLDAMDNHFVPNLTFGWTLIEALRKKTDLFLISHLEAVKNEREAVETIKAINKAVGATPSIAIKPGTPIESIKPFLNMELYCILIMTVEPGFGGQAFLYNMMPKVEKARAWIKESGLKTHIQVDGGINLETAEIAKKAGAGILVAGSSLYKYKTAKEMSEAIKAMRVQPK